MQGRKLAKPSRLTPPPAVFCKYSAFLCWVQTKTNKKNKATQDIERLCGAYGTRTRDPMRDRHVF